MKVNYFQLFLIDVKFYFYHVSKLTGNVLIKNAKNEYNRYQRFKSQSDNLNSSFQPFYLSFKKSWALNFLD